MGDFLDAFRQAFYPGYRIPRVDGWEGLKKLSMPRDCEGFFRDIDESKPYVYYKSVDSNGVETLRRYNTKLDMPEEFDPDKYVTKKDLDAFKEDIVNELVSQFSAKFPSTQYEPNPGNAYPGIGAHSTGSPVSE